LARTQGHRRRRALLDVRGSQVTWLLDPRLNMAAGATIATAAAAWTLLAIALTSEPPNVIAMSGVALVLAGLTMMQNALTMRKVEVTAS
jgi:hypothetical protein